jgi:hypothetical protein
MFFTAGIGGSGRIFYSVFCDIGSLLDGGWEARSISDRLAKEGIPDFGS